MSLYSDVEFMLRRSITASRLQVDRTLKSFKKDIREHSEAALYQGLADRVKYNLCCARILQGNFKEWDGWQYRDEWSAAMRYGIQPIPFWDGNYTEKLVVIGEQGIGDEVLFASLLPEAMVRCKEVTYACDERLVDLVKRSYGCEARPRYIDARDDLLHGSTAYIPAGDLLPLFRRRKADFPQKPYLKVSPERVKEFEKYRGRVGISWRGRHGFIDPSELGIENPLSLQYDRMRFDGSEGIEVPEIDLRNDIEGVIALISVLDKVVTVPTSVMHFAGSVGKECEVILPERATELLADGVVDELDWHVPEGPSPFYPNQTVFNSIKDWKKHAIRK
jgi:hypothetical protein